MARAIGAVKYCSAEFARAFVRWNVRQPMGRVESCFDNAVAEVTFSSIRVEHVYRRQREIIGLGERGSGLASDGKSSNRPSLCSTGPASCATAGNPQTSSPSAHHPPATNSDTR